MRRCSRYETAIDQITRIGYAAAMSERAAVTAPAVEKQRPAHWFKPGQSGNPHGRVKGSRSKLSENFLGDLHDTWEKHGKQALEDVAVNDPSTLIKTIASLLPRDVQLDLTGDAASFARNFEQALAMLGNAPPRQRPRLPNQPKVIEHDRHR